MKSKLIITFVLLFMLNGTIIAQKLSNLSLEIQCYQVNIDSSETLKVMLGIKNNTNKEILVPSNYISQPYNPEDNIANLFYEVYFIDSVNNSVNLSENYVSYYRAFGDYEPNFKLAPNRAYYFYGVITKFLFLKKGRYKIRFILPKRKYPVLSADVLSDWIYLSL